jgi:hypothetical protein
MVRVMHRTSLAFACSALFCALFAAAACSDSGSESDPKGGAAGTGATGGSAGEMTGGSGGGATGGSSGTSSGGGAGNTAGTGGGNVGGSGGILDAGLPDVDFKYDASDPDSTTCVATVVSGQLTPLDMYMMVDKSTSMLGQGSMPCSSGSGQTCWTDVKTAIKSFVASPSTAGIGVGIQYFPVLPTQYTNACTSDTQCGSYGPCVNSFCRSCTVTHYSTPAVGIAPLPAIAGAISTSIDSITPFGGTPTGPALQGSVNYTSAWAQSHPGHKTVIVLATDGVPTDCTPIDINSIASIASAALNGPHKILTFVIGVGNALTTLNAIANAGGTTQAYLVDTGGNVQQQFLQAMQDIQKKTLGCEYQMPKTDAGIVDPNQVEIEITPSSGPKKTINKLTGAAQCGSGDGFYYDNNSAPTKILLCPATCNAVQADTNPKVNISLGCLGS